MASVKVILYEHKKLKDGSHPILIQLIKDRKRKTISTGHSALKSQWNKKSDLPNSKHPNQSLLTSRIKRIKTDINDIVLTLENKRKPFNVEDIINAFKRKKTDITFQEYCNQLVNSLKESGKTGNSNAYLYCSKSVNSFIGDKEILLDEIDYKFVKNYKEYLQKKEQIVNKGTDKEYIKKLSDNGISFYLRTLRAIINKAIKDDLIDETSYPFKNISI